MIPEKLKFLDINKVLLEFNIAHIGWECDSTGWIVLLNNGHKGVVMTNHGSPNLADASELESQIELYQNLIDETKEVLKLLSS